MASIALMGSTALESLMSHAAHSSTSRFRMAFQQLGQDLKAGNTTQAETDLAMLQPATSNEPSSSSPGFMSAAFNKIAQDLQSGNLTAAQSDYATLQQNLQQHSHVSHHLANASSQGAAQTQQVLAQLGQALQSGNLSAAQQAYATLQTDLPGFMFTGANGSSSGSAAASSGINISV
jgi:hypothetical protein